MYQPDTTESDTADLMICEFDAQHDANFTDIIFACCGCSGPVVSAA